MIYPTESITKAFRAREFYFSDTAIRHGIDNEPPSFDEWENIEALVMNCLQPAREALMWPIRVTSGYRCPELNGLIGGSQTSQHMKGEAADLICPGRPLLALFKTLLATPFDQLIWEYGRWVHVSHSRKRTQRGQVLHCYRQDGKTVYTPVLMSSIGDLKEAA